MQTIKPLFENHYFSVSFLKMAVLNQSLRKQEILVHLALHILTVEYDGPVQIRKVPIWYRSQIKSTQ